MGRAYAAPPGTPAARVAALRRAFDATMKDPDFRAAAKKRKMELGPKAGAEMQKIVEAHIATESAVVARAKAAVGLK
jgi:tripartite-type tricarboxylate transporter receptor subunit TctC